MMTLYAEPLDLQDHRHDVALGTKYLLEIDLKYRATSDQLSRLGLRNIFGPGFKLAPKILRLVANDLGRTDLGTVGSECYTIMRFSTSQRHAMPKLNMKLNGCVVENDYREAEFLTLGAPIE